MELNQLPAIMSNLLKPERLNLDPQSSNAAKYWKYWFKTFENFIIMCGTDAPDKHLSLINLISSDVYEYVEDCTDYDSVKNTLEKLARETICGNCEIRRHNTKCLSKKKSTITTALLYPSLCATGVTASFPPNLQNAGTSVLINGHSLIALIDSGSSDSFISQSAATQLKLQRTSLWLSQQ